MTGLDDLLPGVFVVDGAAGAEVVKLAPSGIVGGSLSKARGSLQAKRQRRHKSNYTTLVIYTLLNIYRLLLTQEAYCSWSEKKGWSGGKTRAGAGERAADYIEVVLVVCSLFYAGSSSISTC